VAHCSELLHHLLAGSLLLARTVPISLSPLVSLVITSVVFVRLCSRVWEVIVPHGKQLSSIYLAIMAAFELSAFYDDMVLVLNVKPTDTIAQIKQQISFQVRVLIQQTQSSDTLAHSLA